MNTPATLAGRLKLAMNRARINRKQLAEGCGVSGVAVHKWLSGSTGALRENTCAKAATVLGVSPQWLNTGEGPRRDDLRDLRELDSVLLTMERQAEETLQALRKIIQRRRARGSKRGR